MKLFNNIYREAEGTQGGDENADDAEKTEEKTFTQAEVDELITKRLNREKKKSEKLAATNEESEPKAAEKEPKENAEIKDLKMKVLCFDHDIAKEHSKKALALANAYLDEETDIDEALEQVLEDFPQFKKGFTKEEETETKQWGNRQSAPTQKASNLEALFKAKNPNNKF